MEWEYIQPVRIIFGNGKIHEIKKYASNMKNPILITGEFFSRGALVREIKKECKIEHVFDTISQNPDVQEVNLCSRIIREEEIDGIIAIGGGSTLDLAKAASVRVEHIEQYHWGGKRLPGEHLPVIAVPTTSGTGSEVTCVSVLTDRQRKRKAPIVSDSFYPELAIVDPELTLTLPPYYTAVTGIDVLCHAVEGYWSKGHQPVCDALALHAIRLVMEYLPIAYENPDSLTAREKMAEASVIAGMAFTLPKTTSSHACSFPLTNMFGIPHGEACGLTLDYFIRVNKGDRHAKTMFEKLGYDDGDAFADAVANLKRRIHLRRDLSDLHIRRKELKQLIEESHHPNMLNNPVFIDDEILWNLYHSLLQNRGSR